MTSTSSSFTQVRFLNKNVKISPRKLRLWVAGIKKLSPITALTRLRLTNNKSARILVKALTNVLADAKNNFHLDPNSLKFSEIRVDEGLKIKRMDKSHGSRFARGLIYKRHSRLTIILSGTSATIPEVKKPEKSTKIVKTPKIKK